MSFLFALCITLLTVGWIRRCIPTEWIQINIDRHKIAEMVVYMVVFFCNTRHAGKQNVIDNGHGCFVAVRKVGVRQARPLLLWRGQQKVCVRVLASFLCRAPAQLGLLQTQVCAVWGKAKCCQGPSTTTLARTVFSRFWFEKKSSRFSQGVCQHSV